jgi:hypothetical protein
VAIQFVTDMTDVPLRWYYFEKIALQTQELLLARDMPEKGGLLVSYAERRSLESKGRMLLYQSVKIFVQLLWYSDPQAFEANTVNELFRGP